MTTADESLFSFVPNLVWLPRSLAGFSDAHFKHQGVHDLHHVLRAISRARYAEEHTLVEQQSIATAWEKLPGEASTLIDPCNINEIEDGDRVTIAARRRTLRVASFLTTLIDGELPDRRVSRRYHAGRGSRIDRTVPAVQEFVDPDQLSTLRDSIIRMI